jgi:hypothetical protein
MLRSLFAWSRVVSTVVTQLEVDFVKVSFMFLSFFFNIWTASSYTRYDTHRTQSSITTPKQFRGIHSYQVTHFPLSQYLTKVKNTKWKIHKIYTRLIHNSVTHLTLYRESTRDIPLFYTYFHAASLRSGNILTCLQEHFFLNFQPFYLLFLYINKVIVYIKASFNKNVC